MNTSINRSKGKISARGADNLRRRSRIRIRLIAENDAPEKRRSMEVGGGSFDVRPARVLGIGASSAPVEVGVPSGPGLGAYRLSSEFPQDGEGQACLQLPSVILRGLGLWSVLHGCVDADFVDQFRVAQFASRSAGTIPEVNVAAAVNLEVEITGIIRQRREEFHAAVEGDRAIGSARKRRDVLVFAIKEQVEGLRVVTCPCMGVLFLAAGIPRKIINLYAVEVPPRLLLRACAHRYRGADFLDCVGSNVFCGEHEAWLIASNVSMDSARNERAETGHKPTLDRFRAIRANPQKHAHYRL